MEITEDFCGVIFQIVCSWNFFTVFAAAAVVLADS